MRPSTSILRGGRRKFLRDAALAAGAVGLGAVPEAADLPSRKRPIYDYDIDRFRHVDPALIHYRRVNRFPVAQPEPRRLAMGRDQRIYLAAGRSLFVLDRLGTVVSEIPVGAGVRSVAAGEDGTLHLGVKDHIEVFDPGGKRLAVWDAPKGRPLLTGIAVGRTDVFVADAGNRIIWRYDRSGTLLRRIGERDPQRNIPGFVVPSPFFDVELGADGYLRVANPGRHQVETYTLEGDLELAWGRAGAALDAFCGCCNPINIELLADGRVVTFEKGLPRVKVYSAKGELESVVAAPSDFADPARRQCEQSDCAYGGLDGGIDSDGRIYVLDLIGGDIQVLARN